MEPSAAAPVKTGASVPIRLLGVCAALLLAAICYNSVGGWTATHARGSTLRPAALPLQRRALCADPQFASRPICARVANDEDVVVVAPKLLLNRTLAALNKLAQSQAPATSHSGSPQAAATRPQRDPASQRSQVPSKQPAPHAS
jgi:hypothetical protein